MIVVLGVSVVLMDRSFCSLIDEEREAVKSVLEDAVQSVMGGALDRGQPAFRVAWEVIKESEAALKQPNRWGVREMVVHLLGPRRRADLEWARRLVATFEFSVGGELSLIRKLKFVGKFPFVLYKMVKCALEMTEEFDEAHSGEAATMLAACLRQRHLTKEIVVVDRLIVVHPDFKSGKKNGGGDDQEKLNKAWTARLKGAKKRWVSNKRRVESKQRLGI